MNGSPQENAALIDQDWTIMAQLKNLLLLPHLQNMTSTNWLGKNNRCSGIFCKLLWLLKEPGKKKKKKRKKKHQLQRVRNPYQHAKVVTNYLALIASSL